MYINDAEGFDTYKAYLAIKQHFTSSYDFFKYEGKVSAKLETFKKRNDKYFFVKLGRKYKGAEIIWFLVANLMDGDNIWIGTLASDSTYHTNYLALKKRVETMDYTFRQDCEKLSDLVSDRKEFNNLFKVVDNRHPTIVQLALQRKINIESFIILDKLLGFVNVIEKNLDEPYIWGHLKRKCEKLNGFIFDDEEDIGRYKSVMKKVLIEPLD